MTRKYSRQIEDVCGALKYEGVPVPEIERRLHDDEAGLGFPCAIKQRRIYEYIRSYEEKNGPPPEPGDKDQTLDSTAKMKRRALAVLAREINHLERKRPGSLSVEDSAKLRQHFATVDDMERREEQAAKRRGRSGKPLSSNGGGEPKPSDETALERLARKEAEVPPNPVPV